MASLSASRTPQRVSDSHAGLRDTPFRLMPDPRYFYANPMYRGALEQLTRLQGEHCGIILLTGKAGTGKTILLKRLMLNDEAGHCRFIHSEYASLSMSDYLALACRELRVEGDDTDRPRKLETFLASQATSGQKVIFLIDEAHNIPLSSLADLVNWIVALEARGIPLRVIFSGQPELENNLRMAGVGEPGSVCLACLRLEQLDRSETANFIRHRLEMGGAGEVVRFAPDAIARIHECATGIPRIINLICGAALLNARSLSAREVSADIVEDVIGTSGIGRRVDYMAEGLARVAEYLPPATHTDATRTESRALRLAVQGPEAARGSPKIITAIAGAVGWLAEGMAGLGRRMARLLYWIWLRRAPVAGLLAMGAIFFGLVSYFSSTSPVATPAEPRLTALAGPPPARERRSGGRHEDDPVGDAGLAAPAEIYAGSGSDGAGTAAPAEPSSQAKITVAGAASPRSATASSSYGSDATRQHLEPQHEPLAAAAPQQFDGEPQSATTTPPREVGLGAAQQDGAADTVAVATLSVVSTPEVSGSVIPRQYSDAAPVMLDSAGADGSAASSSPQRSAGNNESVPSDGGIAPAVSGTPAWPIPDDGLGTEPAAPGGADADTRAEEVNALLNKAEALVAARRYTKPSDDNALAVYREVLQLAPRHPRAVAGMERIRTRYMQWGRAAEDRQHWSKANYHYELALTVDPEFAGAVTASQRVATRQQERKQQVARVRTAKTRDARQALSARGVEIGEQALFDYAEQGNAEVVDLLLAAGVPPDRRQSGGWSALMYASIHGHVQVIRSLIQQGASLNLKNQDGTTALIAAASNGHLDAVRVLLENGANINAQNNDGWTPLMYAAWNGQLQVVKELLARGANIDTTSRNNWTAKTAASDAGHLEILKLLTGDKRT